MKNFALKSFNPCQIEPKGWLLDQLKIQASSLSGNLDKIWPDIRDSKYIGGDREGWERVPYWLDGFIPLAYLLKDDGMISRAKKYINAIIRSQKSDGWICPCQEEEREKYDMWAFLLLSKVLVLYFECSGDERIESVLSRALKNFSIHIEKHPLFGWGKYRWFEGLIAVYWLYDKIGEAWLLDLAHMLCRQGTDYNALCDSGLLNETKNQWTFDTHVVNLAMAIKSDALMSRITCRDGNVFAEKLLDILFKYHGNAVGHFNGDECLASASPIRGTELCGVAEAMYSYETLFSVTGNPKWVDSLEKLAFNAFPAAMSPDMWTHQYDQMVNQISCVPFEGQPIFGTNGVQAHIFGLEPNFGCCTANFNQAFPKFALSTFYHGESGIISAALAPSKVSFKIDDIPVSIELDTLYPFRNTLKYTVIAEKKASFELAVRIPSWVTKITFQGTEYFPDQEGFLRFNKQWSGTESIVLEFTFDVVFEERPKDMVCLRRGPLYYSVAIKEDWHKKEYISDGVERKFPYCDYEIRPLSKWNLAYAEKNIIFEENDLFDMPFSSENPPVRAIAKMREIPWGFEEGFPEICARVPKSRVPRGPVRQIILHPYGCTNLRMTELPLLK